MTKTQRTHAVSLALGLLAGIFAPAAPAQDALQLLNTMVAHEADASSHRGHYTYTSEETSDRTGGHLWRERVAETGWGKVRYLVAVDGHALTGPALDSERARLAGEASDPEGFKKAESARVDDEQHAKQMLTLLLKAFLFDAPAAEGAYWRIHFRPNPGYSPANLEEKVLHGMTGSVLVDRQMVRLREIDGTMPADVGIGFGLLATIRSGSNFATTRTHLENVDWKTETLHTDIRGKALFLKTIARKQDAKHTDFHRIADTITVADAVQMLEK